MLVVDEGTGELFGDEDGETYGLFGILGGVVYWPIGAPRSEKNAVGELDGQTPPVLPTGGGDGIPDETFFSRNRLHTGTETFYGGRTIDVAAHVAMAGTHGVLDGEVEAMFGFACFGG